MVWLGSGLLRCRSVAPNREEYPSTLAEGVQYDLSLLYRPESSLLTRVIAVDERHPVHDVPRYRNMVAPKGFEPSLPP